MVLVQLRGAHPQDQAIDPFFNVPDVLRKGVADKAQVHEAVLAASSKTAKRIALPQGVLSREELQARLRARGATARGASPSRGGGGRSVPPSGALTATGGADALPQTPGSPPIQGSPWAADWSADRQEPTQRRARSAEPSPVSGQTVAYNKLFRRMAEMQEQMRQMLPRLPAIGGGNAASDGKAGARGGAAGGNADGVDTGGGSAIAASIPPPPLGTPMRQIKVEAIDMTACSTGAPSLKRSASDGDMPCSKHARYTRDGSCGSASVAQRVGEDLAACALRAAAESGGSIMRSATEVPEGTMTQAPAHASQVLVAAAQNEECAVAEAVEKLPRPASTVNAELEALQKRAREEWALANQKVADALKFSC